MIRPIRPIRPIPPVRAPVVLLAPVAAVASIVLLATLVVASAGCRSTTARLDGRTGSSSSTLEPPRIERPGSVAEASPDLRTDSVRTVESPKPTEADDSRERVEPATPAIRLGPGLEVDRAAGEVRLSAQSALDAGWLEQAICLAGTREHESLLVVDTSPRLLHAALLMLGLEPGRPGRWRVDETTGAVVRDPPEGPRLEIVLRYEHPRRGVVEEPLSDWFLGRDGEVGPLHPWRFAGSLEESDDRGTVYVADFSGSVAGLVTFGDEVIAHEEVLADRLDVEREPFRVAEERVPPPGTPVTVAIRRAR